MDPTLVGADLVDLIDDDPLDVLELLAEDRRREDDGQGLWGRDEDVGRLAGLALALALGGVTGADGDPDLGRIQAQVLGQILHLPKRFLQVLVDVIGQGLEG